MSATPVRSATSEDVADIAALAQSRRLAYERAQPQFWRVAEDAVARHAPYLTAQIEDLGVVSLVARDEDGRLLGYLVASLVPAPPVYEPGGPSGFVDDFACSSPAEWPTVGVALLTAARAELARRGAAQVVVVCGHHDEPKLAALQEAGLTRASEWLVAPIET